MRKAINTLQAAAAVSKKITAEVVYRTVGYVEPREILELISTLVHSGFLKARDKLRQIMYEYGVSGKDVLKIFQRELMKGTIETTDEGKIELMELASDIDYRLTEGCDEEIQMLAFLSKLQVVAKKHGLKIRTEETKEVKEVKEETTTTETKTKTTKKKRTSK